jgi:fatty acid desaturase
MKRPKVHDSVEYRATHEHGREGLLLPTSTPNRSPRETMRSLPGLVQPLLTALTGRPLPDEKPLVRWSGTARAASVLLLFALSIAGTAVLISGPAWGWLFLPLTVLLTAGAARAIQIGIVHHASHKNLTGIKWLDRLIGEVSSASVFILSLREYARLHPKHHGQTATKDDPDFQFVVGFGFRPGMTQSALWQHLWRTLFGWQFHAAYALSRIRSNFVTATWPRRLLSIFFAGGLLSGAAATGMWLELVVAYVLPVGVLFQIAGLLQTLTEHQWVWVASEVKTRKALMGELTFGRYCGEPMPDLVWSNWRALTYWALRMLVVHWVVRVLVLQLDLPNHPFHHRFPQGDWANATFAQRDDELSGEGAWGPYREAWGLQDAIAHNFRLLASLPPDAQPGDPLTSLDRLAGM